MSQTISGSISEAMGETMSGAASASTLRIRQTIHHPGFTLKLDLTLPGSGVIALFGPSGSGKTTGLRSVAGLRTSHRAGHEIRAGGLVVINGDVWQDDTQGLFLAPHLRAVGYVFQEASLFAHLSVAQNLNYGQARVPAPERRVSLQRAIALLGIGHLLTRTPHTLSGGERQRIAIARALATSPRLLLMDEPLAALDAARKAEILPYLESLSRELAIPILYVSHAVDEVARLADHLVLLEAGQVLASGATADLMTRLDLPMAHGDAAGAVIIATVASHDPLFHLTLVRFDGGELHIPQQALNVGQTVRVRVQARDVSLSLAHQTGTSIQNILPVRIEALSPESPGQVMVRLDAAGTALLARVTARSIDGLNLAIGQRVFAQVKGVAILG